MPVRLSSSRGPLRIGTILLPLLVAGCGGTGSSHEGATVTFTPTDAGVVSLVATPAVPAGTNASAAVLDLAKRASFRGNAYSEATGYGLDAVLTTKDGRTLTLHAIGFEPFAPGTTLAFDPGGSSSPSLVYEEGGLGQGHYRKWEAQGGTLTLDALDATGGTAHVAGAKMVALDDGIYVDGQGSIRSTSKGDFTLDAQVRIVANRGSVAFTDGATAALRVDGFATPGASLSAYTAPLSARSGIAFDFFVPSVGTGDGADATGGSFEVALEPGKTPVAAGRAFALGTRGGSASFAGFYPGDGGLSRFWTASSGTATIRELHGHVATVDLADVRMRASANGATGTFTANGSVVVEFP